LNFPDAPVVAAAAVVVAIVTVVIVVIMASLTQMWSTLRLHTYVVGVVAAVVRAGLSVDISDDATIIVFRSGIVC
jgi:hypothetical protein